MRSWGSQYRVHQARARVKTLIDTSVDWRTFFLLLFVVSTTLIAFSAISAQETAQQSTPPSIVQGVVLDSVNKPISGAEVIVTDPENKVIARTKSGDNGGFRFSSLKAGTYRFTARSIGYAQGISDPMKLGPGDTLDLQFVLDASSATIEEVRVVAAKNAQYRITAEEIEKTGYADALDVVLNRRIRMLGDTYKGCMSDTSTFTKDFRYIRKPPKSMSMDSSMPLRLYINGVWHGVRSIKDVLSEIPAKDIAEMNYVDCWDTERPNLRNSLMVVLKPGVRY